MKSSLDAVATLHNQVDNWMDSKTFKSIQRKLLKQAITAEWLGKAKNPLAFHSKLPEVADIEL